MLKLKTKLLVYNMSVNNTNYGYGSLNNNTGKNNSAFGAYSAYNNLDASNNTAIGTNTLFYNTLGNNNTALGAGSLCNNNIGDSNTAVGSSALEGLIANQSVGNENVAVGAQALYSNTGDLNTSIGTYAGKDIINGNYNTFLGANTSYDNTSSYYEYSTAIGYGAAIDSDNQIMMGIANTNVIIPGSAQFQNYDPLSYTNLSLVPKEYVDTIASGLKPSYACVCATTASINNGNVPSGSPPTSSTDDVIISNGDYVLVINQGGANNTNTSNIYNGIWIVNLLGTWYRPTSGSMSSGSDAAGVFSFINSGNTYGNKDLVQINNPAIVDLNPLEYTILNNNIQLIAGRGISIVNDIISVDSSLNFINYLDNSVGPNTGTLNIGTYTTNTIIGSASTNPVVMQSGVIGPTGTFTYVKANQYVEFSDGTKQYTAGGGSTGSGDSNWNINNNSIYNTNTGNVGIGTTTPVYKLDVVGNAHVSNNMIVSQNVTGTLGSFVNLTASQNVTGQTGSFSYLKANQYVEYSDGTKQYTASGGGGDSNWSISNNNIFNTNTGNVGIGTSTPLYKLDVLGNVHVSSNMIVSQNVTGTLGSFTNLYASQNLDVSGNSTIAQNLDVKGTSKLEGYVGINMDPNINFQLDVSGNANVTNTFTANAITLTSSSPSYNSNSVVTKSYVDAIASGVKLKESCDYATTDASAIPINQYTWTSSYDGSSNFTNVGTSLKIDGYDVSNNDRVLVRINTSTTDISYNGIYIYHSSGLGTLTRSTDLLYGSVATSVATFINYGKVNAKTTFLQVTNPAITGINDLVFYPQSSFDINLGPTLILTGGNTLNVNPDLDITTLTTTGNVEVGGSLDVVGSIKGNSLNTSTNISFPNNKVQINGSVGQTSQGSDAVAIGPRAGQTSQGSQAVAVGPYAGQTSQGSYAVAMGFQSGQFSQGTDAVAIGPFAGNTGQGSYAVAMGFQAGQLSQGTDAVAIGPYAGHANQPANSIIINASGEALNGSIDSAFYVKPIRSDSTASNILQYNTNTNEITYTANTSGGGTGSFTYLSASQNFTGTTGSFTYLNVTNTCTAGSFVSGSDYRIKENIKKMDETFSLDPLKPVTYFNKNTQKQEMGFIADEVQQIFPFLVDGEKDGENIQSLNYIGLIALLVKELQDIKKELNFLKQI